MFRTSGSRTRTRGRVRRQSRLWLPARYSSSHCCVRRVGAGYSSRTGLRLTRWDTGRHGLPIRRSWCTHRARAEAPWPDDLHRGESRDAGGWVRRRIEDRHPAWLGGSGEFIARSGFIDHRLTGRERLARAEQIMQTLAFEIPVVLKPNEGQRGWVKWWRAAASRWWPTWKRQPSIRSSRSTCRVSEFGVSITVVLQRCAALSCRSPSSICRWWGDGRRTLEQLIFAIVERGDDALSSATTGRASQRCAGSREGRVAGDCGSHCRGATFLDGRALLTPALEQASNRMARSYGHGSVWPVRRACRHAGRARRRACVRDHRAEWRDLGTTTTSTIPRSACSSAYRALFEQCASRRDRKPRAWPEAVAVDVGVGDCAGWWRDIGRVRSRSA